MTSIQKVQQKLGVSRAEAVQILTNAEEYANSGRGLVVENRETIEQLAQMFRDAPVWMNYELNDVLGWQFSQALFYLRRAGWKVQTLKLTKSLFAYKLVSMPQSATV